MNIRLWLAVLLALASAPAAADVLASEAALKELGTRIMTHVGAGRLSAAFATMKPFTALSDSEFDAAAMNSQLQRERAGDRYGRPVGFELVSEKRIGESLVRLIYIEKTQRHALPWLFFFYRTPEGWILNSFMWDDNPIALFDAH